MIVYKNNYYEEDEKLFSTGNSDLDDILEEVYYSGLEDGYDYAQKEFTSVRKAAKAGIMMGKKVAAGDMEGLVKASKRLMNMTTIRNAKTLSGLKGEKQVMNKAAKSTGKALVKEGKISKKELADLLNTLKENEVTIHQNARQINKSLAGKTKAQRLKMAKNGLSQK